MPTISSKLSERELKAIAEYANACGETVSNLIRKVVIGEAIFINWENDKEYEHGIQVPHNVSGEEETQIVQGTYNKIRKILGLEAIEI
jgi:hypothetical protein